MERITKLASVKTRLARLEANTGRKLGISNSDNLYMLDVYDEKGVSFQPYSVRGIGLGDFYRALGAALEGARLAKRQ